MNFIDVSVTGFTQMSWSNASPLLIVGCTSAVVHDAAADVRQPTDDGYSTVDDRRPARHGTARCRHGTARHAVTNAADPSAPAASTEPTRNDAGRLHAGRRSQRRRHESSEFHCSCSVTVGYLCWTFGSRGGRAATNCRTAGTATAATEDHLVRSVIE